MPAGVEETVPPAAGLTVTVSIGLRVKVAVTLALELILNVHWVDVPELEQVPPQPVNV